MPNILLYQWNIMGGCDPHLEFGFVPPSPFPVPFPWLPHLVGMMLEGITGEASLTTTVLGDGSQIVQMGSDIGSLIPHFPLPPAPPFLLALLWTGLSSSKSLFGPHNVKADGKAVAAALFYGSNPQLHCNQAPVNLPLGVAITWGTVLADITPLDILLSALDFAYESIIDALEEKLVGHFVEKIPILNEEGDELLTGTIVTLFGKLTKGTPVEELIDKGKPSELVESFAGEE